MKRVSPSILALILLFSPNAARSAVVDPEYHQGYQWWLEAYDLLSRVSCKEAQHFFHARKLFPLPFCSPRTALEGLASLERTLHPKADEMGLPERPEPDFDRELYHLEAREEFRIFHPRAPDGIYELSIETAGKRCALDTECSQRDRLWRSSLASSPVLSEHLSQLQWLTCENAALHAVTQARSYNQGSSLPDFYAFRFSHCLHEPILCDLGSSSSDQLFALHPSCLQGVQHETWLNLRKENLSKLRTEGQLILSRCSTLPQELRPTSGRSETLELLSCFSDEELSPSSERAGLLQIPLEQLSPDTLDYYFVERRETRTQEKRGFFGAISQEKIEIRHRVNQPSDLPAGKNSGDLRIQANFGMDARHGTLTQQSALRAYLQAWLADRILYSPATRKELKQVLKSSTAASSREFMIQKRAKALMDAGTLAEQCLKQE